MTLATMSGLTFPCAFPIKAVGRSGRDFEMRIVEIVRRHAPELNQNTVTTRPSKGGGFIAVTIIIQAVSQAQLDAIYRELSGCPDVIMAL
jgi:putative lipoic acid-binding regulatory protein